MDVSKIVGVLEGCELFRGLDKDEIEKIANLGSVATYQTGENILNQGDMKCCSRFATDMLNPRKR